MTHPPKDVMSLRLSIGTAIAVGIAVIAWVVDSVTWAADMKATNEAQDVRITMIETAVKDIQISQKEEAQADQALRVSIVELVTELRVLGVVGRDEPRPATR